MKRFFALMLAIVCIVSLCSCGLPKIPLDRGENNPPDVPDIVDDVVGRGDNAADDDTDTDNISDVDGDVISVTIPSDSTPNTDMVSFSQRQPQKMAAEYVAALASNKYDAVVSALAINNSPFVTGADVKYGVLRSDYAALVNKAGKSAEIYVADGDFEQDGSDAYVDVSVEVEDGDIISFPITLHINENDEWQVVDEAFVVSDFVITSPSGETQLYIDGTEVLDEFMMEVGVNGDMRKYSIAHIGAATKEIRVTSANFDYSTKVSPTESADEDGNDGVKIRVPITDEELVELYAAVRDLWNALYTDWTAGISASDAFAKHFTADADPAEAERIWRLFGEFQEDDFMGENINAVVSLVDKRTDYTANDNFWASDKAVVANFAYQLDYFWTEGGGNDKTARNYSHVMLAYENGTYKMYRVTNDYFFSDEYDHESW